ncbi:hypothetical protein J7L36_00735 [bacterium]|nr:hypothetical protein [bacterium]
MIKTEERPEEESERPEERPKRELLRKIGALVLLAVGTVLLYFLFSLLYWYLAAPMSVFWITDTFIPSPPPVPSPIIYPNGTISFYSTPSPLDLPALKTLFGGFILVLVFLVGGVIAGRVIKAGVDLWREKTSREFIREIRELRKALKGR